MFAIDGTEAVPRPTRQPADQMPGGDEDLLVREGDALSLFERGDGRAERRDAGRRDEDHVSVRLRRQRDEGVRSERRARGRELHRQVVEGVRVAIRAERDKAQSIGLRAHDIQGLPPDRTGGAEDRKPDRCGHNSIIPER